MHLSKQSKKFLKKVDKALSIRLYRKIEKLQEKPFLHDTKIIEGENGLYRVRVGDYRILYKINYENKFIGVVKIDKRTRAY